MKNILLFTLIVLSLAAFAQPPLNATHTITNPTCYGAPNGAIMEFVSGGTAPYTIVCNGDTVSNTIYGLVAGTYYITVHDAASNIFLDTAIITSPPTISVQIEIRCIGNNTVGLVSATGGTAPYNFSWTYDNQDFLFGDSVALYNDTVRVITSDNFGCTYVTDTVVNLCSSLAVFNLHTGSLRLYPNPAGELLFIESTLPVTEVCIYSATGALVARTNNPNSTSINVSQLPAGIYIAEIKTGHAIIKRTWVKQ